MGERRYATLAKEFPEKAKVLLEANMSDSRATWNYYRRLASIDYSVEE